MRVHLFVPCYTDQCHPETAWDMVKVLEGLGHEIIFDEGLICCGQPGFNSGYWEEARPIARRVMQRLAEAEVVVIGSGSCGAMLKVFYPQLFSGREEEEQARSLAARTWEFSSFLVDKLGVTDVGARYEAKVTFHDGCHGLRELRVKDQPRQLLAAVQGLELLEMAEAESCCGFGGAFAVKNAPISTAMGEVKCASALETGAEVIVSNDTSCLMQIEGLLRRGDSEVKTLHLASVLAAR